MLLYVNVVFQLIINSVDIVFQRTITSTVLCGCGVSTDY